MSTLRIRTPEGIDFALPLAGPMSRFLAWMLDFLIITLLAAGLSVGVSVLGIAAPDFAGGVMMIGLLVLPLGYGMVCEARWRGQTPGKRVFQLRVVDARGLRLTTGQIILRNLLRAVDFLPFFYLVGGTACVLSRRRQRLGDLAAGTVVIRLPRAQEPDLGQLLAGKFNSLRAHPHLVARLRQQIPAAHATLALQALLRRDELEPGPRVALYAELAESFRRLVEFPPEVAEALTDEQYLRNVVDVLYRTRD